MEVVQVHNIRRKKHLIFLTKMSRHLLTLLEFTNTRPRMVGIGLYSHMCKKQTNFVHMECLGVEHVTPRELFVRTISQTL